MSTGFYLTPSVIYLNLGVEMMFVLTNRMKAQKVNMEKVGNKILGDLVKIMFKKLFIQNIIKPQIPLSIPTFFELFSKVVNSSSMKLDSSSIQKLFYLILMTFKKQLFSASSPLQIYSLTVNHLKQLFKMIPDPEARSLIDQAINQFREVFKNYSYIQYLQIRQQILSMLQSYHSRIILFVETGFQTDKGIMIHVPRNHHNKKKIGMAINHASMEFQLPEQAIPETKLQLQAFLSWKTDIATDRYDDSRGSSKNFGRKRSKEEKQTSMFDFLGLNSSDLGSYEVELDIFASSSSKVVEQKQELKEEKPRQIVMQKSNDLVKNILSQFVQVEKKEAEEEDEVDLLDMMDN